jgi:hypothetical protein
VSEYGDPDLETIAPVAPASSPEPGEQPPPLADRGPLAGLVVALVVVSLVVGFGTATLVLNARNSGTETPVVSPPFTVLPDPAESVLGGLIVRQRDVPAGNAVTLLNHGADLSIATLDLCNGLYASESQRTARRQVALADSQGLLWLSTEAVLYRAPSAGAQAFRELRSVTAHCPSSPVVSPVGEGTATTKFGPAPDGTWPRTASVERVAYDFVTTDAATGGMSHSIAVYLRRGRALIGVYFPRPDGPQVAVDGRTTIAGIVGVFEARLAQVPAGVTGG